MNQEDQIIGELKEFKRMAISEFSVIRNQLEQLNRFRWSVYATSGVISFVIGVLIAYFRG